MQGGRMGGDSEELSSVDSRSGMMGMKAPPSHHMSAKYRMNQMMG
jgi:hypothetical protein